MLLQNNKIILTRCVLCSVLLLAYTAVFCFAQSGLFFAGVIAGLSYYFFKTSKKSLIFAVILYIAYVTLVILFSDDYFYLFNVFCLPLCTAALFFTNKKNIILSATIGFLVLASVSVLSIILVQKIQNKTAGEIASEYIINSKNSIVVTALAENNYKKLIKDDEENVIIKVNKTDDGYTQITLNYYSEKVKKIIDEELLYNIFHFCALIAILAVFISRVLTKTPDKLKEIYLPTFYPTAVFLPIAAVSILGMIMGGAVSATATAIFNAGILMPNAVVGVSVAAYIIDIPFEKHKKISAAISIALIVITVFIDYAQLFFACIGCINLVFNLRLIFKKVIKD